MARIVRRAGHAEREADAAAAVKVNPRYLSCIYIYIHILAHKNVPVVSNGASPGPSTVGSSLFPLSILPFASETTLRCGYEKFVFFIFAFRY